MNHEQPHVIVIAGPNGAGKSTIAPSLLQNQLQVTEFVNADTIAKGLSAFAPEAAAIQAGKVMLQRIDELANSRANFAFETTLASKTFASKIEKLKRKGYLFHLIFLWLPSVEMCINRVEDRVSMGGHNVLGEVVKRRYYAGLYNFFELYQPLANSWSCYDNSMTPPTLIALKDIHGCEKIIDKNKWQQIEASLKVSGECDG